MDKLIPNWPAPPHIKAYTTTRRIWGGPHPDYATNNQGLVSLLSLPSEPLWIKQTHSTLVVEATPANSKQEADASFSSTANQVCVVLTADCLPILICNQKGTQVAAIHAGWRGLAGGIIENTIQRLQAPGDDLLVWLGPAIGPSKFEVGKDVYEAFVNQHELSATAFKPQTEVKWLANLYELAKIRLGHCHIKQIYGGDYCTYTQDDLFYSYRRDQGKTGRMASMIWIGNK